MSRMLKVLLKLYRCTWQSKHACLKTYLWLGEQRWSEGWTGNSDIAKKLKDLFKPKKTPKTITFFSILE